MMNFKQGVECMNHALLLNLYRQFTQVYKSLYDF